MQNIAMHGWKSNRPEERSDGEVKHTKLYPHKRGMPAKDFLGQNERT
jgi:hypothetical protein